MTENILDDLTKEEEIIWMEMFPDFIKYISKEIVELNYFDVDVENEKRCILKTKETYQVKVTNENKFSANPFKILIGDYWDDNEIISCEKFSMKIEIELFTKKIVEETSFWGKKIEKIEKIKKSHRLFPIHITPPNITDNFKIGYTRNYGEKKGEFFNNNIGWFIQKFKNQDYFFEPEFDIFSILEIIQTKIENYYSEIIQKECIKRREKLKFDKKNFVTDLDKDNNGEVDLIDGESFNKLLNKHQKSISEIDNNYIQKFVKISLYLKNKKKNTQLIFESITDSKNERELDELMSLLKNQIHTYELLVFHSISMITTLVESDLITFFEIYESFDQLGMFNSNWENEVSNKLSDIGDGIKELMYSINSMEDKIVHSLDNLTYITQDSFSDLNNSITSQLGSIDSSIKFNNLLTGIQTYQMYKINQNTKRIN